ncbi:MAG: protein-L-isoaspartate(D-aspartate) O-methyltransferase [Deltaproteobacteria bacterium]|nr:protein-L-isoaspartate(D-aspartate) O-methyltransferase [Deltaproteobacteria bacterium]
MRRVPYNIPFLIFVFFFFPASSACDLSDYAGLRDRMVKNQIIARGIKDSRVVKAMERVPRHLFVPLKYRAFSYGDYPLPIGEGQTISQPYIVAFMTEALGLMDDESVLEIGTGSGYQAAILAELVKEVYTIEIISELGKLAQQTLDKLGYKNIHLKTGDGYKGWPEMAPFDAIIVTCAPEQIPQSLVEQLKEGGRMIIPVGREGGVQKLVKVRKKSGRIEPQAVMDVRFVPMVRDDSANGT